MSIVDKKEVLLLKYGELILKGLNRSYFEGLLLNDVRFRMTRCGNAKIERAQSTIYISANDETFDIEKAFFEAKRVLGIATVSRTLQVDKDMEIIKKEMADYTRETLKSVNTFKIEAKRSDKKFELDSPAICNECGEVILNENPHLTVDVHNPAVTIRIEIRDYGAYIHCGAESGAGGMPLGSAGKGVLLLSGGIDSPVAGYAMAKRGVTLEALHFESYPYTSERALEKVKELACIMQAYCGKIRLTVVSVTKIQEEIKEKCNEDYFTLILRRFMMRIAEKTAKYIKAGCIITGESLGQVASQTMSALSVTNNAVERLPVFRPLISMDKEDIVKISRKIDTFETSILPYEDCCTVFTPKHPVTKPILEKVIEEEKMLNIDELVNEAFENRKFLKLN